jgi:glutaminyl-peptide cyclotransferase
MPTINATFLESRGHRVFLCLLLAACAASCQSSQTNSSQTQTSAPAAAQTPAKSIPVLTATVIKAFPHDPKAFTQGLEFFDGRLYESTGRTGQSTLRECVLESGKVLRKVNLPENEFGEGLTIFHGKIYQLTWLSKKGFIYDQRIFKKIGEFPFSSEGWGLTHDDTSLILSDGSNQLKFIDPANFMLTRTLEVYAGSEAVTNLNELEYLHGQIWANVWHSSRIARIDPQSGQVLSWIELAPLVNKEQREGEDVLNGIAYDASADRLVVTGKNWPELFEIKVNEKP